MSWIIVNFDNAMSTSTTISITLTQAAVVLEGGDSLSIFGNVAFGSFSATSAAVKFSPEAGVTFNAQLTVPISSAGGTPGIVVTNFQGTVIVSWPTPTGMQAATLCSGQPLVLTNYSG